jgi:hypothetical protein
MELTQMKENVFTTKIHDLIIPESVETFNSVFIVMDFWERDLAALLKLPSI